MKIAKLEITNIRSFKGDHSFTLSPGINLFVGKNNAGKSTALRCLHLLQTEKSDIQYLPTMNRKGASECKVTMHFSKPDDRLSPFHPAIVTGEWQAQVSCRVNQMNRTFQGLSRQGQRVDLTNNASFSSREPGNVFIPFFSRRKAMSFEHKMDAEASFGVHDNLRHLYAKVGRLTNADDETRDEFVGHCARILDCRISVSPSQSGSEAGIWLSATDYIPVSAMGEGTSNILGMIAELCLAQDKVFLIEELENDIHPEALKALLELIASKSEKNQFLISTHSNIVVRHLGALNGSKIFSFRMQFEGKMPVTEAQEVPKSESARIELLRELGYDPFDLGLWQAYLILEESSAESIINGVLIPHFAPRLHGRLRTISANGITNVEPAYADFHRLFVFLNNDSVYGSASWVMVDGDDSGKATVEKLRVRFSKVAGERFTTFGKPAFEHYYPERFGDEASATLAIQGRDERRAAKRALCKKVLDWASANPGEAKTGFAISAADVIAKLQEIEKQI